MRTEEYFNLQKLKQTSPFLERPWKTSVVNMKKKSQALQQGTQPHAFGKTQGFLLNPHSQKYYLDQGKASGCCGALAGPAHRLRASEQLRKNSLSVLDVAKADAGTPVPTTSCKTVPEVHVGHRADELLMNRHGAAASLVSCACSIPQKASRRSSQRHFSRNSPFFPEPLTSWGNTLFTPFSVLFSAKT